MEPALGSREEHSVEFVTEKHQRVAAAVMNYCVCSNYLYSTEAKAAAESMMND